MGKVVAEAEAVPPLMLLEAIMVIAIGRVGPLVCQVGTILERRDRLGHFMVGGKAGFVVFGGDEPKATRCIGRRRVDLFPGIAALSTAVDEDEDGGAEEGEATAGGDANEGASRQGV